MATNLQIEKLQAAEVLADNASESGEIERRLGAIVIYAGLADFLAIQAARLIEQIILKGQLADVRKTLFQPRPDTYFYDQHISTRSILKEIQRLLPFNHPNLKEVDQAKRVTDLANQMIKTGHEFLNHRNPIVHNIGDPRKKLEDIAILCDQATSAYRKFREAHRVFFEAAARYRFSENELRYFYGK